MKLRKNKNGFTIIEVMIVLAVAGLIALLVFQAIPALTRTSRNNQRKNDVSTILQSVSHYELNNSANFPPQPTATSNFLNSAKLTYYDPLTTIIMTPNDTANQGPSTDVDRVTIFNYQKCMPDQPGRSSSQGADYTDIVAIFALEGGGGPVAQCQQL